jgi:hypothetical protein
VNFPERSRENGFVARLWATQRVGYLSAEKRKQGGSRELDNEIRELGERFGIPTEFTSYLVVEPGMQIRGRITGNGVSAGAPVVVTSPTSQAFDAAKSASVFRQARTVSAVDAESSARGNAEMKRAGHRTFVLRDSVWTDTKKSAGPTLRIKPYSNAYFRLLELIPDLREPLSIAERVRVAGKAMSVEISPNGVETLSGSDISMLKQNW